MLYGNILCLMVTYHKYHFVFYGNKKYGKLAYNKCMLYGNLAYDILLLYGKLPYIMKTYHISFSKYVCKGYE